MTENDARTVWVQKQVIMCCFVTFASFRFKWPKILTVILLSHIDGKVQQNDRKLCSKDLDEKCSYLGLVSIFSRFSSLGSCTFVMSIFLPILMGNNNKMTENDVRIVWVQKQFIMCCFVTFASFRFKWPKILTVILLSHIDGKIQQNDRKLCAKDLAEKCSYLGLVSIFGRFSSLGTCPFILSIFYLYWWETTIKWLKMMCGWFGNKNMLSFVDL